MVLKHVSLVLIGNKSFEISIHLYNIYAYALYMCGKGGGGYAQYVIYQCKTTKQTDCD